MAARKRTDGHHGRPAGSPSDRRGAGGGTSAGSRAGSADGDALLTELRVVLRRKKENRRERIALRDEEARLIDALQRRGVSCAKIADAVSSIEGVHRAIVAGRLRQRKCRGRAQLVRRRTIETWSDDSLPRGTKRGEAAHST